MKWTAGYIASVRLLTIIGALLVWGSGSLAAKQDTLYRIVEHAKNGRAIETLDIFTKFNWHIRIIGKDGSMNTYDTQRPDTIFKGSNIDTVYMEAAFVADTAVRNKMYSFHYVLEGSLKMKLNEKEILATGHFDNGTIVNGSRDILRGFRDFMLTDSLQQIAIVYMPLARTGLYSLILNINEQRTADKYRQMNADRHKESYGEGFYYLAFGIIFMILFAFFREKTENLYFSLFCMFAALAFLWKEFNTDILYNHEAMFGLFCLEFLSMFMYKVLRNKEKSRIPLLAMAVAIAICFLPPVRYCYTSFLNGDIPFIVVLVYISGYAYTLCSIFIYLVHGVGQKQWEAKMIIRFCFVPVLLFLAFVLIFFMVANFMGTSSRFSDGIFIGSVFGMLITAITYLYPLAAVFILGKRNALNQQQLQAQVVSIQTLSAENLAKEQEKKQILEGQKAELEKEVRLRTAEVVAQKEEIQKQHAELVVEKGKSDDLLRNILPAEVMEELKSTGISEARLFDNVTVLFADFVDFTKAGENMTPKELVSELHICFKAYDEIISRYGIEKIKTIGDAYLAVAGLPVGNEAHAQNIVKAAIDIRTFMDERYAQLSNRTFRVRIGVHSGSVVAGIVGVKKFAYDIWGDTVNTAARMEQSSEAGKINISETTYELVKDTFTCEYRGKIEAKNKGMMNMYFVSGVVL